MNQRRLSYNLCLALAYYFRCFACRKTSSLKNNTRSKTDFYLDRGIEKLSRDLDIVNLLDIVKGFHVMKQVLFNQDERFFLHLQRRDMIYSSESSQCEKEEQSRESLKLQLEESLNAGAVFDKEKASTLRTILNRF